MNTSERLKCCHKGTQEDKCVIYQLFEICTPKNKVSAWAGPDYTTNYVQLGGEKRREKFVSTILTFFV